MNEIFETFTKTLTAVEYMTPVAGRRKDTDEYAPLRRARIAFDCGHSYVEHDWTEEGFGHVGERQTCGMCLDDYLHRLTPEQVTNNAP